MVPRRAFSLSLRLSLLRLRASESAGIRKLIEIESRDASASLRRIHVLKIIRLLINQHVLFQ